MPPGKRKAQQALQARKGKDAAKSSEAEGEQGDNNAIQDSQMGDAAQVEAILAECEKQVETKAESLIEAAHQRVQILRSDSEAVITRIAKQVRTMSAVEFLSLTPAEAATNILHNFLSRLQDSQQNPDSSSGVDAVHTVASRLAAASTADAPQPMDAAGYIAPLQEGPNLGQQQTESRHGEPEAEQHTKTNAQHTQIGQQQQPLPGQQQPALAEEQQTQKEKQQQPETAQQKEKQPCSTASGVTLSNMTKAMSLMPPPPPRLPLAGANPPVRLPAANEIAYSANGSPLHIGQLLAPTDATKGIVPCLSDVTPALANSVAIPPAAFSFTGRTFRRAAPTRGRAKQPTRAITVTTHDGRHFTVDDLIGMAAVPQAYRDEVRQLVEADQQDLNALVQAMDSMAQQDKENDKAVSAAGASTSHPTRRR